MLAILILVLFAILTINSLAYAAEHITESTAFLLAAENKSEISVNFATEKLSGREKIELDNSENVTGVSVTGSVSQKKL